MVTQPSIVALIPARAGSKRIPGKNSRLLGGKPLLTWTIEAAQQSGIFSYVFVPTDSEEYAAIARICGAIPIKRTAVPDDEPDITWVVPVVRPTTDDAFAILRPTSPFRTADTIRRAWAEFLSHQPCDSLRAVEPVRQHPGKMWVLREGRLLPLLPWDLTWEAPWHSSPTQCLPPVYVQNASLEIAWIKMAAKTGTIAGTNVVPFFTQGYEGFDINMPEDWERAERIVAEEMLVCL